jgi:hypothetical protein
MKRSNQNTVASFERIGAAADSGKQPAVVFPELGDRGGAGQRGTAATADGLVALEVDGGVESRHHAWHTRSDLGHVQVRHRSFEAAQGSGADDEGDLAFHPSLDDLFRGFLFQAELGEVGIEIVVFSSWRFAVVSGFFRLPRRARSWTEDFGLAKYAESAAFNAMQGM